MTYVPPNLVTPGRDIDKNYYLDNPICMIETFTTTSPNVKTYVSWKTYCGGEMLAVNKLQFDILMSVRLYYARH